MMNLKLELFKGLVFLVIGAFLGYHFKPNDKPQVAQEQQAQCKASIIKVTEPDGTVKEETSFESDVSQKQAPPKVQLLPNYGVGIYNDKSLQVEARLGSMPLFLMGEGNLKGETKIGLKFEF